MANQDLILIGHKVVRDPDGNVISSEPEYLEIKDSSDKEPVVTIKQEATRKLYRQYATNKERSE